MAKKATRSIDRKTAEQQANGSIKGARQWLDVEARLGEWSRFFGSVTKPFLDPTSEGHRYGALRADAPQIARVAHGAVCSVIQAKQCVAESNIRGLIVYLLDMAEAACTMFFLDSEGDAKIREKAREILDIGRRIANESEAIEAERIANMVRDEVEIIRRGSPVKMTSTSAREALARHTHFLDGTPMVKLRTINKAFSRESKRKSQNR